MKNKRDIYDILKERNLWHEITEHPAVYNMEEITQLNLPHPEADAKNLFVRDDKKRNYCLITVQGEKRVDLKDFRKAQQLRPLSFASEQELKDILGLTPGAVSPFGLLNDEAHRVTLFLDQELLDGLIGIHPNDNTATVWLKTKDLVGLIRAHGSEVVIVPV